MISTFATIGSKLGADLIPALQTYPGGWDRREEDCNTNPTIPFLVHAPTMRVPGCIEGTDKVYNATWAALLAIHAHNRLAAQQIEVAAFLAMGTGFGGKWRRPTAITGSRPTGWTGSSSQNVRRRSTTTAPSR